MFAICSFHESAAVKNGEKKEASARKTKRRRFASKDARKCIMACRGMRNNEAVTRSSNGLSGSILVLERC